MSKTKDTAAAEQHPAACFTKEELLQSKRFAACRDALAVVLADGKTYTVEQAEAAIEKFYQTEVH